MARTIAHNSSRVAAWLVGGPLTCAVVALLASAPAWGATNEEVSEGSKVVMGFTITVPETNTVIPNNVREFVSGRDEVFPAVDRALKGMKPGQEKRIDLAPDEAFGQYDGTKKVQVKREILPPEAKPGTILKSANGVLFTVAELGDASAVLDYNHPLAGKHVVLDVKILEVQ
jgi:FKBP-type peptidyl-prolyl cis-trans isomerase 2